MNRYDTLVDQTLHQPLCRQLWQQLLLLVFLALRVLLVCFQVLEHDIGAFPRACLATHDFDFGSSADQGPLPMVPKRPRATDTNCDTLKDPTIRMRRNSRDDSVEFFGQTTGQEIRGLKHGLALLMTSVWKW